MSNDESKTQDKTPFTVEPTTCEISCGKCGQKMRVHRPSVSLSASVYAVVYILATTWSVDERKCAGCGAVNLPSLRLAVDDTGAPLVVWNAVDLAAGAIKPAERSRIVLPTFLRGRRP